MSECDVVARLGQPTAVNLGRNANGLRSAVLTFQAGPRPGIYRFNKAGGIEGRKIKFFGVQDDQDSPATETTAEMATQTQKNRTRRT